jgi:glycosyltransferase involved in cell wall biosynthesis
MNQVQSFSGMNKVYLRGRSGAGPIHSIYKELTRFPPDEYQFVTGGLESAGKQRLLFDLNKKFENIPYAREVWREAKTLQYVGIRLAQDLRVRTRISPGLIYASQQLVLDRTPWVVDFEYANALVNYGDIRLCRRFVQKALSSTFCKGILPWSDWAKRTLYRSLNCASFKEKIERVHFAVSPKAFIKSINDDKVRFLFVGSTNRFNFLNFEWKGGYEVVDAFLELSKKYDRLELVMRSWVPPEIQEKCVNRPDIKVLGTPLSEDALARLYASSDVFLFPTYLNLGMAILEAMSYELPVITVSLYDIPEAVQDTKTGVLLKPPPNVPYYSWNGAPNHYDLELLRGIRRSRAWMVNQIVGKASLLIEDTSLRKRLGREARQSVEQGEFSIKKRNEELKRIFDEATSAV